MMGMLAGREDMVNDELVNAKKTMSDQFDNYLQGSGRKGKTGTAQIMKQINRGNFEGALKLIERGDFDTRKGTPLSDADKANMIQAVHDLANTNKLAKERVANIKASGVDIEKTINDEIERQRNRFDLCDILNEFNTSAYLYPSRYNDENEMTRWFDFIFVSDKEFLEDTDWQSKYADSDSDGRVIAVVLSGKN